MSLTAAPNITAVRPDSPEFQAKLRMASAILRGTVFSVYSRHEHYPIPSGCVIFEELIGPGEFALYPMSEDEAAQAGLPSCWGVDSDGQVVVLRYADRGLYADSGIDVTSAVFEAQLADIGTAFTAAGLYTDLEINIAARLFPHGEDQVTYEETDLRAQVQRVTIIPATPADRAHFQYVAACWTFGPDGAPVVSGVCAYTGTFHDSGGGGNGGDDGDDKDK